jgi:pyridoxal phosphate enzyme (YggS family)
VAVSKFQDAAAVERTLVAGQRVFGESRVQEAEAKWERLRREFPDVELQLIGRLQTNKVRAALRVFDVVATVDRERLAVAIGREIADGASLDRCLIQVNTGQEPQKGGIPPQEADRFIVRCRDQLGLPVTGVMCIPPGGVDPEPHFEHLRRLADRHDLAEISMGMSDDYPLAIRCGATHVRLGRAVFGDRPATMAAATPTLRPSRS